MPEHDVAHILIVEDEALVAAELQLRIEDMGYGVTAAVASAEAALEFAEELRPDLVMMDVKLRGEMDGIEAAEKIGRLDIPVIFLTAFADEAIVQRAKQCEPFGYLLKPFDERLLNVTIETALYRHRLERERRRAEEAQRASEALYREILRSSHDAVVTVDARQRIVVFNQGAERIFGYASAEALGKPLGMLLPETCRKVHARQVRAFATGDRPSRTMADRREIHGRRKDGEVFPARASISKAEIGGEPLMTSILRDVTAEYRLQEHLRQVQKVEALAQIAAGVVHDFNNMLGAQMGIVSMLMENLGDHPESFALAEDINDCCESMARLIRRLLVFRGDGQVEPEVVDVAKNVRQTEKILRHLVAGSGVRLTFESEPGECFVLIEPGQLEQILINLVVNSRDAMPNGGRLTIRTGQVCLTADGVHQRPALRTGDHVVLEVEDTGEGMDEAIAARVFEPFFTTKADGVGTGLGLATVFNIATTARGHVEVESSPGEGTLVRVFLPAVSPTGMRT